MCRLLSDLLIKMIQQNVYVSHGKGTFGIQQTGHQPKKRNEDEGTSQNNK